jgi:hypothetical protein
MNKPEPNIIHPEVAPFIVYDLNIWADTNDELRLSVYPVSVINNDWENISGTDYDRMGYSYFFDTANELDWPIVDWLLCSYLSLPDWSDIEGLDEWTTFYGDTSALEADCMGNKAPMPARLQKFLKALPAYKPKSEEM